MRVGLFGGSFNPPHFGHLELAKHAREAFELDEVWLLVTPQNPEKREAAAPFEHRCHMCELLAVDYPWLKLSTLEAECGARDSFASIRYVQNKHPEHTFIWLMGTDNFKAMHMWEFTQTDINYHNLMRQIPMVVYARDLLTVEEARNTPALEVYAEYEQPRTGPWQPLPNWRFVVDFDHDASATMVRLGEHEHIPPSIQAYIAQNGLYKKKR